MIRPPHLFLLFACCVLSSITSAGALAEVPGVPENLADRIDDWPWWRGFARDGSSPTTTPPLKLDLKEDIDWKVPVPGRGHASPIVVRDRIYLLSADEKTESQFVVAFERETGEQMWLKEINRGGFTDKNHPKNTEATSTLASDGERLFAALWHRKQIWGVALTIDGELLWESRVGPYDPMEHPFGYAPSPIVYGESVIYSFEYDGPSALVAFSRETGAEMWRRPRPESTSYSTPVVASHAGRDYLLLSGADKMSAYDPSDGTLIWEVAGTTMATSGTIVWWDGMVFASGGFPGAETMGVRIESGEVVWRNRQKAYEQSMLVANGSLYNFTDSGVLYCWDCKTGKEQWRKRMQGPVSASGVTASNLIYWANESGTMWIFEANSERYAEIGKFQIGDEAFASPALCGSELILRIAEGYGDERQEYLVRFRSQ